MPHAHRLAPVAALFGLTVLGVALWLRASSSEVIPNSAAPRVDSMRLHGSALSSGSDLPPAGLPAVVKPLSDPLAGLPAVMAPVSTDLHLVADRTRDELVRLRPLTDGSVQEVHAPQDVVLIRRILRDPGEGDTIRNEAANLLGRSQVPELVGDLEAVLAHPAEQERFRSFAMQHLGVHWNGRGSPVGDAVQVRLRAGLDDRHVAVRREALLALARGQDALVPARVAALLSDPMATAEQDLAARVAAECKMQELLPALRPLLAAGCDAVVRIAAMEAVARLGDTESLPALHAAEGDANPRVAAAAAQALAALEGVKP
jgi:HEAT repeat protein